MIKDLDTIKRGNMKTRIQWIVGLVFLAFFIGTAQAQDGDLLPLKPVPDAGQIAPVKTSSPKKPGFDGKGALDDISKDSLWINDSRFMLAPNTEFYDKKGRRTLKSRFSGGMMVGYVLEASAEEKGKAFVTDSPYPIITSLWEIEKKAGEDEN